MWFLRRMMLVSWTAKVRNEEVLRITEHRSLLRWVANQEVKFFGHVFRKEELDHLVITVKTNSKKISRTVENDGLGWSRIERGRDQKSQSQTTSDRRCQLILHKKKAEEFFFQFFLKKKEFCFCINCLWKCLGGQ